MNDPRDSLTRARQRARAAKQRELAVHERAARLHDQFDSQASATTPPLASGEPVP